MDFPFDPGVSLIPMRLQTSFYMTSCIVNLIIESEANSTAEEFEDDDNNNVTGSSS